jgi:putative Mn2+ efflux pump MntP
MQITIFIILLALILVMFFIAEYIDVILHIVGFALLFVLGMVLLTNQLYVTSGQNTTQAYTYMLDNTTVNTTTTTTTDITTPFSDWYSHIFGILTAIVGAIGGGLVWYHYKKPKEEGEGEE